MKYAGFWLHIAAGLCNALFLMVMLFLLFTGMLFCVSLMLDMPWAGLQTLLQDRGWGLRRLLELLFLLVITWYYLYVVHRRHASLGQLTCHLRIVMTDGSAMTLRALMLRKMVLLSLCTTYVLGMWLSALASAISPPVVTAFTLQVFLGWYAINSMVALSNERGRSLEDIMAGTVVIKVANGA